MNKQKVVIIGMGLIGGSLAAGLKARQFSGEIIGVARRAETCAAAIKREIVDRAFEHIDAVASELTTNDIVVIAVPTLTTAHILADLKACRLHDGVTITDAASVKGSVQKDAITVFGSMPSNIVLGHPIAGSEKSGIDAANPNLYVQHRVIITPVPENTEDHIRRVTQLWSYVGAEVIEMDVAAHDLVLAATSHLPHAIAFSLVDTLAHDSNNENIFRYAAGGFRDFTRIASSDAAMWRDIMLANSDAVLRAIDLFSSNLARLHHAIETKNASEITGVFTRAKVARDRFTHMLTHTSYSQNMQESIEKNVVYTVTPGGAISGKLRVPGDKSISHRSIMLGSLAEGVTHVTGFLEGEDALATLQSFRDMGVVIDGPSKGEVTINGVGLRGLQQPAGPLYLGNSGTSMRLLAGILSGQEFDTELTGDDSLSKRPMNRVIVPLQKMGASIASANEGRPPLNVKGGCELNGIDYALPMASAQVKSCVLLAGLYAKGTTVITEPAPTRDHTERMLRGFGYPVKTDGSTISIEPGGTLRACDLDIPADISSATFFMVAAAIAPGSDVTLTHVGINPTRIGALNILRLMGADIRLINEREVGGEPVADIRVKYSPLTGIKIPESQVPLAIDEFPALLVAAACAEGQTVLSGAEELRVKETDRIQAMADGLVQLGIDCQPTPDGMIVNGGQLTGGKVESFHDHRIAMSFAVAGLRASGPVVINNCANVATSFPNFTVLASKAGISIDVNVS